jgi:hypothetical protein
VEWCELGEVKERFVSTVFTCRTEEVYIHGGESGGFNGICTGEVFTGGLFTVRSDVLRLSAVAVSAVGVPGH